MSKMLVKCEDDVEDNTEEIINLTLLINITQSKLDSLIKRYEILKYTELNYYILIGVINNAIDTLISHLESIGVKKQESKIRPLNWKVYNIVETNRYSTTIQEKRANLIKLINIKRTHLNILIKIYKSLIYKKTKYAVNLNRQLLNVLINAIDTTLTKNLENIIIEKKQPKIRKINNKFYSVNQIFSSNETQRHLLYECDNNGNIIYSKNCDFELYRMFNDEDLTDETIVGIIKTKLRLR